MFGAQLTAHDGQLLAALGAHMALVEADLRGSIIRHNAVFAQCVQASAQGLTGIPVVELLQAAGMASLWEDIATKLAAGQGWQGHLAFSSGDSVIWLHMSWIPLMGFDKLPVSYLGVGMNATAMQTQLALLTEELNKAERALLHYS